MDNPNKIFFMLVTWRCKWFVVNWIVSALFSNWRLPSLQPIRCGYWWCMLPGSKTRMCSSKQAYHHDHHPLHHHSPATHHPSAKRPQTYNTTWVLLDSWGSTTSGDACSTEKYCRSVRAFWREPSGSIHRLPALSSIIPTTIVRHWYTYRSRGQVNHSTALLSVTNGRRWW